MTGGDVAPAAPRWSSPELALLGLLAIVATLLRLHEYTGAPVLDDNQDILQFAWSGMTLITRHMPYAWDLFNAYHYDYVLHLNNSTYYITHPWFSHPPLLSVLAGGWAYLMGARDFADVTPAMVRPVAIILSGISLVLVYALARRVVGIPATVIGTLIFAVSPGAVLLGREIETEAPLAPLMLGALLMTHHALTSRPGRARIAALILCCLLMPLAKVTGIVIVAAIAFALVAGGRWRLALATVTAGIGGLGLYALYGAIFDWHLFLAVISEWRDLHRHGLMAGYGFITESAGIGRTFHDGWYPLGWFGLLYLALRRPAAPAAMLLAWPCLVYAAGLMALGDPAFQGRFGWYRIVLYPLLYMGAGMLTWEAIRGPAPAALLAVIVLGGATAFEMVTGQQMQPNPYVLAALIGLVVAPAAISFWRSDSPGWRFRAQVAGALAVTSILAASAVTSYQLAHVYRGI